MRKNLILLTTLVITLSGCDTSKKATENTQAEMSEAIDAGKYQTIDTEYLDLNVSPKDDFFNYANGQWLVDNPVPASESRWGSFNELDLSNKKKLTKILEEAKNADAKIGSTQQILGDYYASYIDMEKRNSANIRPLKTDLSMISGISSKSDLPSVVAALHKQGVFPFFYFGVGQDLKNVDQHIVNYYQAGTGLPNKDYYLKDDKKVIKDSYTEHIANVFEYMSRETGEVLSNAEDIVAFETSIAEMMMSPAEQRVPENTYNKFCREDFIAKNQIFSMDEYISLTGIESFDSIIVGQPIFMKNINKIIDRSSLETIKGYLTWCLIDNYAGHLSENMVQLNFDFYGTVLTGKSEMKPIGDRAIDEITRMEFGELLGKAFVGRHFSDASQQRVNAMVDNLLIVFKERIIDLDWMTKETKTQALTKLESIGRKLGFPNKWEDFSDLDFKADDYFGNVKKASVRSYNKNLAKLNLKVDK